MKAPKTVFSLSLLALALLSQPAMALTVKSSEVANKIREVSLSQVRFEGQPAVVLADAKGISVYTFDLDSEGKSACQGDCLDVWPTLKVAADAVIVAPFGTITGNDGKRQLTLKGLPLYYYVKDKKPGDVKGHYPSWQLVFVKN
jgi:predicted lipoprotein with Yx(FWY)xxD motif